METRCKHGDTAFSTPLLFDWVTPNNFQDAVKHNVNGHAAGKYEGSYYTETQRPCKPEENSQTPAMYVLVIRVSVAYFHRLEKHGSHFEEPKTFQSSHHSSI